MTDDAIDVIRRAALRYEPDPDGFGAFLDWVGHARVVLVGEASHGTHEFPRMGEHGGLNLGQLARQAFGARARLVGFTTHRGTVTAASNWGDPADRKRVRPSLAGSCERLFHDVGVPRFQLLLDEASVNDALRSPRLERAIGVIYRPETERVSHYFRARLAERFDAVLHIDETRPLAPLERWSAEEADVPETYPSAL